MAKTTAPLLSFDASGTIAKTQVYSRWKGVRYARRYSIPNDPNSTEQQLTRNTFKNLQAIYKLAGPIIRETWQATASGQPLTEVNAFLKSNVGPLREQSDMALMIMSAGSGGGLAPTLGTITPGADQLTVNVNAPAVIPTGWTIHSAKVAAIFQQDPQTMTVFTTHEGEDTTSTYQVILTGLTQVGAYRVFAWLKWNRPDGKFAYSVSVTGTGTPS